RGEDSVIAGIEERIAEWTHVPPENGEPMQILRYVDGQKYDAHWDWFDDPVHHAAYLTEGNRYATVLLYLSEVEGGGETNLPLADPIDAAAQVIEAPSECAAHMGISVKPHKGDALLFFDMDIAGAKGDRKALHASCPTLKGMKWTATKWLHNKSYMGRFDPLRQAGRCEDEAPDCAARVAAGGCTTDMDALIGRGGVCRKSCDDCVSCPSGDILCARRNMRSLVRERAAGLGREGAGVGAGPGAAPGTGVH
ncbi:Prolyl 4-hydroxylase subunit alpha-2, partial [Tetrabaena socialis]